MLLLLVVLRLALGLSAGLPPELAALPPVDPDYQPSDYRGRVVQVTRTSVFIQHEGVHIEVQTVNHNGRCEPAALYRQDNKRPFHKFEFDPALFPNLPITKVLGLGEHYASEVRIGDIVRITNDTRATVDTCTAIAILRRPGGTVPPSRWDSDWPEGDKRRMDVRRNAEQFVEEKVVPALPRLFLHMHR